MREKTATYRQTIYPCTSMAITFHDLYLFAKYTQFLCLFLIKEEITILLHSVTI